MRAPLLLLVLALSIVPVAVRAEEAPPTSLTEILGLGSTGPEVSLLQTWLSQIPNLYPEKAVTGFYGPATERAVLSYQKKLGLISTRREPGVLGSFTRATLNAQFSENQGGIAWVEGGYSDALLWDGKAFSSVWEKRFRTSGAIVARLSAWVYPSVLPERPTVLYMDMGGRALGVSGGRIFVRAPNMTDVVTDARHLVPGRWQHISVLFTADNAIFLYNDAPVEAGVLTARPPSFFERIAALFSSFFPKKQAPPASPTDKFTNTVSPRPTGFIAFFSSSSPTFPTFQPMPTPPVKAKPITLDTVPSSSSLETPSSGGSGETTASTTSSVSVGLSTSTMSATSSVIAVVTATSSASTSTTSSTTSGGSGGGGAGAAASAAPSITAITLLGSSAITIATGDPYTDPGATALSPVDGNITSSVVTTGTVNQYIPGTYTIYYDVTDSTGFEATTVTRTVTVTPPSPLPPEAQQPNYALAPAGQAISLTVDTNAATQPRFVDSSITPLHVYVGDTQTYTVKVQSTGAEVTSVTATTRLDSHTFTLPLSLVSVDATGATFSASWVVFDTHNNVYRTTFTATDELGRTNSITLA
ncbi:MAG: immunoglobulin-like domain-containing protein, partial [Patescibacteria group bacterium]